MPRVRQKKLVAIGSDFLILAMMFWPFCCLCLTLFYGRTDRLRSFRGKNVFQKFDGPRRRAARGCPNSFVAFRGHSLRVGGQGARDCEC